MYSVERNSGMTASHLVKTKLYINIVVQDFFQKLSPYSPDSSWFHIQPPVFFGKQKATPNLAETKFIQCSRLNMEIFQEIN